MIAPHGAPAALADPTPRLLELADRADAIEGRVPVAGIPLRVWHDLSDAERDAAIAARRVVERDEALLADFANRHGIDLRDRSALLDQAETMARAEADFAYYNDADAAVAGSLDTGQQNNIGDDGRPRAKDSSVPPGQTDRARRQASRVDRLLRYDRAKVGLQAAIRESAGVAWEAGDVAGATLLDGMAGRLDGCRKVKAYQDACGAWFARPESCHVRTCPDCERSRSARLVRRLDGVAADMTRPAFWTFTIPNVPLGELGLGIDVLLDAFAALRRLAIFRGGQCRGAHDDLTDPEASRRACRHAPHRRDRAAAGTCVCARCTVSDHRGEAGDVGPCAAKMPSGEPVASLAESAGNEERSRRPPLRCRRPAEDHEGAGHPYRPGRRTRGCRRCRHEAVRGGVYAVEVTFSERGDWHPHLHALVDAPFILQAEMRDAWRASTCDAIRRSELRGRVSRRARGNRRQLAADRDEVAPVVEPGDDDLQPVNPRVIHDVADGPLRPAGVGYPIAGAPIARPAETGEDVGRAGHSPNLRVPRCPHKADADGRSIEGCRGASMVWVEGVKGEPGSPERRGAIRETVKYVTKGVLDRDGVLNPAIAGAGLAELLLALRGRRLVSGWGTLRHVTDDPDDEDDGATGERLSGPDVLPELRGLPVTCPVCRQPADWQLPILVDRRACRPIEGGILLWQPPPPGSFVQ